MKEMDMTEQAYRNGYAAGVEDGKPKWIPASKPPKVHRVPNSSPAAHLLSDPVLTYRADGIPKYNISVYTRGESEVYGCWYTHDMIVVSPDWWIPIPELPEVK